MFRRTFSRCTSTDWVVQSLVRFVTTDRTLRKRVFARKRPCTPKDIIFRPDSGIPSLRSRNSRIGQGGKTAFILPMLHATIDASLSWFQQEAREPEGGRSAVFRTLQLCEDSRQPASHARNGGWIDGSCVDNRRITRLLV